MVVGVVLLLLTLLMLENIGGADAAAAKKKRGAGKGGGKARVAKRRGRRKVPKKVGADGSGTKLTEAEAKKFIKESKQAKAFNAKAGMWDQLMPQLTCTACERALFTIQNELSKLILRDATLDESKAFVDERVHDICGDPVTFPPTNEPYRNACHLFMQGHEQQIIDTLYDRLDPDSENYQEDIPTWIFCREIEACAEGQVSLDQQLREADL